MYTLAFESTAKIASVALMDDDRTVASYTVDNGLTQSELLLPMAERILADTGVGYSDIGLLACAVGPGSFTGVRIGTALVKGIALSRGTACAGVSTLAELAENLSGMRGIKVAAMDARRGQVYAAVFLTDGGETVRMTQDTACSLSELCETVRGVYENNETLPVFIAGDGYEIARAALVSAGIPCEETPAALIGESAVSVGRIAYRMYKSGETVTAAELNPVYLRLPQAERERLERLGETKKD